MSPEHMQIRELQILVAELGCHHYPYCSTPVFYGFPIVFPAAKPSPLSHLYVECPRTSASSSRKSLCPDLPALSQQEAHKVLFRGSSGNSNYLLSHPLVLGITCTMHHSLWSCPLLAPIFRRPHPILGMCSQNQCSSHH